MAGPARSQVEVVAVGRCLAGAVLWRMQGRLNVTVVVKATFAFTPDGPMTRVEPEELVRAEVYHQNNPMRCVRLTSDMAPFLKRADVVLTGHACAPGGAKVEEVAARLLVYREGPLVDKTVHVRGDTKDGQTVPFQHMPLVYERALGGVGFDDNPLGLGAAVGGDPETPNLTDPTNPRKVACFGPISRVWPARKGLLGTTDRSLLDRPIAEIPTGFDWSYFQAAPPDQRCDYLHGNEWIMLYGMTPSPPQVRSHLPWVRGVARVHGLGLADGGAGRPMQLAADSLRIDADKLQCSLVWRGSFPVSDDAVLPLLKVYAAVEGHGQVVEWPAAGAAREPLVDDGDESPIDLVDEGDFVEVDVSKWARTAAITPEDSERVAASPATPFRPGDSAAPPREHRPGAAPQPAEPVLGSTIDDTGGVRAPAGPLPFASAPPPPPPPPRAAGRPAGSGADAPGVGVAQPAARATPRASVRAAGGLELVNDTGLTFGVVPWGPELGRDCLTVIVKATCDLLPGARAKVRARADPLQAERFVEGDARGALAYPSDLAPYKVRADVVALGHAIAPNGAARVMEVRFAFGSGEAAFDRTLLVLGDRRWERGGAADRPSDPEPFMRMPLRWERAFGGPKVDANPIGIGAPDPMRRGPRPLPNLEDPARRLRTPKQQVAPACFAPIPLAWKDRIATRGRARAAWPLFPEDHDWTRFQAAPAAQQLPHLSGDEPFGLYGMHASHPALEGSLPGKRARCFAVNADDVQEVELRLDTAIFDVDELRLDLVFRGALPVVDEQARAGPTLHLFVEDLGAPRTTLDEARARLLRR